MVPIYASRRPTTPIVKIGASKGIRIPKTLSTRRTGPKKSSPRAARSADEPSEYLRTGIVAAMTTSGRALGGHDAGSRVARDQPAAAPVD